MKNAPSSNSKLRAPVVRTLAVAGRLSNSVSELAARLEEGFETRFESIARDPKVLAFVASSLNYATNLRLEARKFEIEISSLKLRLKLVRRQMGTRP